MAWGHEATWQPEHCHHSCWKQKVPSEAFSILNNFRLKRGFLHFGTGFIFHFYFLFQIAYLF